MFTGLVEKVGLWNGAQRKAGMLRALVKHDAWNEPLAVGESIAVQGVCLTVVSATDGSFECDLLEETAGKTTLGRLRKGALVNLERALRAGDRIGGHIVLGHVDGMARLRRIRRRGADRVLEIECGRDIMVDIAPKGSVALDGISLTVVEPGQDGFAVHIIPHTWENTSLRDRVEGDLMNIEVDIMAKAARAAVERMFGGRQGITPETLRRAGFAV